MISRPGGAVIGLIQRVSRASVTIEGKQAASIDQGLLALVGIEKHDTEQIADRLLERMLNYRVFADDEGKMNLSLRDIEAGLLLVPQFTLVADTSKGNRPGFSNGAPPDRGNALFDYLLVKASRQHDRVGSGVFGADMKVELLNDGPVTFWLQV
jgi:D-tyrosyl-tRNA(Tyr) deacylase